MVRQPPNGRVGRQPDGQAEGRPGGALEYSATPCKPAASRMSASSVAFWSYAEFQAMTRIRPERARPCGTQAGWRPPSPGGGPAGLLCPQDQGGWGPRSVGPGERSHGTGQDGLGRLVGQGVR